MGDKETINISSKSDQNNNEPKIDAKAKDMRTYAKECMKKKFTKNKNIENEITKETEESNSPNLELERNISNVNSLVSVQEPCKQNKSEDMNNDIKSMSSPIKEVEIENLQTDIISVHKKVIVS